MWSRGYDSSFLEYKINRPAQIYYNVDYEYECKRSTVPGSVLKDMPNHTAILSIDEL